MSSKKALDLHLEDVDLNSKVRMVMYQYVTKGKANLKISNPTKIDLNKL